MLNMTRWTPWTELASLHRDLDSIVGRVFGETGSGPSIGSFVPADVRRDGDKWLLSMALPAISPENVEIEVVGRTLRVRGERVSDGKSKAEAVLTEISYGRRTTDR